MLSEDEIHAIDLRTLGCIHFAREIIAAHTAKLLAGVEIGEPVAHLFVGGIYGNELEDWEIEAEQGLCDELNEQYFSKYSEDKLPLYTADQLLAYGDARDRAGYLRGLDEAKQACLAKHANGNWKHDTREECADAIESLKGKQA